MARAISEGAGFAPPEPIYRLRFDKAAPLPVKATAAGASGDARPKPVDCRTQAPIEDASPDAHIARLVDEERAKTSDDDDLLDIGKANRVIARGRATASAACERSPAGSPAPRPGSPP